jgi:hypothetical protein
VNIIAQVSCNLVKDLRLNNYKHETFNPPISTLLIKGKKDEKKLQQIEQTWFEVNSPNSEVKFFFTNAETNLRIKNNCLVFVTCLLQQIK